MKSTPKIEISRDPYRTVDFSHYAAVINVGDSPLQTFRINTASYWFPVHETGLWGYSPFYGAAKVVDHYGQMGMPILIHCHAGANRSPTITYAILASNGYSDEQIAALYPHIRDGDLAHIYSRNVERKCVYDDTIKMLSARYEYPLYCLAGLLQYINSPNVVHGDYKRPHLETGNIKYTKTYAL